MPLALVISLIFSFLFQRKVIWIIIGSISVAQVIILAYRPEDYNSDTFNYSRYIELISDADGLNIFAVSKFEPVHLGLVSIAGDFRVWLILEAILCAGLIVGLIRRLQRLESIAIILGSAVPLFSSSMRFSVGLLAVAYAMVILPQVRGRSILISTIGLITHVSLIISGFLQRGKLWQILISLIFVLIYLGSDISIVERAGGGEDSSAGGTGLRAFLTLLIFLTIVYFRRAGYDPPSFRRDLMVALLFLLSTIFIYPVFNRFIVLLLIIKSIQFDSLKDKFRRNGRFKEALTASFLYLLLVIPHLVSMNNKTIAGDW